MPIGLGRCTTAEVSTGDASPSVDNILLITIDTLRWDALGFSGNGRSRTPHLDRLAASGLEFRDAHAHNVVTLPSHANILTGLYPYQNGIRDNKGFVLPESIPTAGDASVGGGLSHQAPLSAPFHWIPVLVWTEDSRSMTTRSPRARVRRRWCRLSAAGTKWYPWLANGGRAMRASVDSYGFISTIPTRPICQPSPLPPSSRTTPIWVRSPRWIPTCGHSWSVTSRARRRLLSSS